MIRGLPAIGLTTLLFAGCAVYDSSLTIRPSTGKGGNQGDGGGSGDTTGGGGGPGNGGSAGAGGASGAGGADCAHVSYPPHPTIRNAGGDKEIVAVQYDIDLGDSPMSTTGEQTRYRNIGFDLDGYCSTSAATAISMTSCTLPPGSMGVVDGPQGQDNAVGQIVQITRNTITQFSSEIYTQQLQKGAANAILHVTGYNGLADDDQVRVEALVSAQFDAYKKPGSIPNWDGNDVWPVASDSVMGTVSKAKNFDNNGYVSNHKLVATFTSAGLRLVIGLTAVTKVNLSLVLHAAYVVCDIEETDAGKWGYTLTNCTLAGRWVADDLVKQLANFPDPLDLSNPKPLCISSTSYPIFKDTICKLRDLRSEIAGPTAPCDALSFGVIYNTRPGLIGDVFANVVTPPKCPPGKDPSLDSCEEGDGGTPSGSGGGGGASGAGGADGGGKGGASGAPADAGPDASGTDASL